MVAPGGHAWLLQGGRAWFFDEIRSMSGRYASYWNAFLFLVVLATHRLQEITEFTRVRCLVRAGGQSSSHQGVPVLQVDAADAHVQAR